MQNVCEGAVVWVGWIMGGLGGQEKGAPLLWCKYCAPDSGCILLVTRFSPRTSHASHLIVDPWMHDFHGGGG